MPGNTAPIPLWVDCEGTPSIQVDRELAGRQSDHSGLPRTDWMVAAINSEFACQIQKGRGLLKSIADQHMTVENRNTLLQLAWESMSKWSKGVPDLSFTMSSIPHHRVYSTAIYSGDTRIAAWLDCRSNTDAHDDKCPIVTMQYNAHLLETISPGWAATFSDDFGRANNELSTRIKNDNFLHAQEAFTHGYMGSDIDAYLVYLGEASFTKANLQTFFRVSAVHSELGLRSNCLEASRSSIPGHGSIHHNSSTGSNADLDKRIDDLNGLFAGGTYRHRSNP